MTAAKRRPAACSVPPATPEVTSSPPAAVAQTVALRRSRADSYTDAKTLHLSEPPASSAKSSASLSSSSSSFAPPLGKHSASRGEGSTSGPTHGTGCPVEGFVAMNGGRCSGGGTWAAAIGNKSANLHANLPREIEAYDGRGTATGEIDRQRPPASQPLPLPSPAPLPTADAPGAAASSPNCGPPPPSGSTTSPPSRPRPRLDSGVCSAKAKATPEAGKPSGSSGSGSRGLGLDKGTIGETDLLVGRRDFWAWWPRPCCGGAASLARGYGRRGEKVKSRQSPAPLSTGPAPAPVPALAPVLAPAEQQSRTEAPSAMGDTERDLAALLLAAHGC
mmetsp:Transcript_138332/g.442074  ORF Transcript_138332/g.442074 Transcript_138332/m.442074 type:complete len:333 (-) Transcript_138332:704-1702(-)